MSRPASPAAATVAQITTELRLTARRGENLLVTLVIPVAVLLFFTQVAVLSVTSARSVDVLLPGVLALAVIATSFVNLGIATAYERLYGVLKRLGGSPLGRGGLLAAKIATVLAIEVVQVMLLIGIAAGFLGWRPGADAEPLLVPIALAFGTVAFAGLGLLLAGTLRAEATLAVANGLFLACLLLGGILVPTTDLPGPLGTVAGVLPAAALADAFRIALGTTGGDIIRPLAILGAWGIAAVALAVRTFRWD